MAVRYKRQYSLIIQDLVEALKHLEGYYRLIGFDDKGWNRLDEEQQYECLKTMSHDIIYGLGTEPIIEVGNGKVQYESQLAQIRVFDGDNCVHVVRLN
ncbi:MAG: hypothetical protein WBI74_02935 [Caldicoprobacterales bacterium]|jgi:hypothetical protein|nr:hypothetical protein [Clostridiales bacterium]